MPSPRRAVLLSLLAVTLGFLLLDAHGSPRQAVDDLRQTWTEFRESMVQREP